MNQFYKNHKNHKKPIFSFAICTIIIICIFLVNKYILNMNEKFDGMGDNGILTNKSDRTLLYGSLFLDNLGGVIKNMTDPPINYDTKRIEIIRYSDVLL